MKKLYIIFCFFGLILLLSSCSTINHTANVKSSSFVPDKIRFEMYADDFELMGEVEISYESRRYLGFLNYVDKINGQDVPVREIERVNINGLTDIPVDRFMRRAAVKVIEQFPDADYYIPHYSKITIHQMFLGRRINEKMVIRAYKLKYD